MPGSSSSSIPPALLKYEERLGALSLGVLLESAPARDRVRPLLEQAGAHIAPAPQLRTAYGLVTDQQQRSKLIKTLGGSEATLSIVLAWLETTLFRLQQESADRAAYWLQFGTTDDAKDELTVSNRYHRVVQRDPETEKGADERKMSRLCSSGGGFVE